MIETVLPDVLVVSSILSMAGLVLGTMRDAKRWVEAAACKGKCVNGCCGG